jgi:hypothetical protein
LYALCFLLFVLLVLPITSSMIWSLIIFGQKYKLWSCPCIMQFPSHYGYFLPFRSKHALQYPVLKHPLLNARDGSFTLIQNNRHNFSCVMLTFKFLSRRWKDNPEPNSSKHSLNLIYS